VIDVLPPVSVFTDPFGARVLGEVTLPGGAPLACRCIWLPTRSTYENVGDTALLDEMPTLSLTREDLGLDGEVGVPVGTRVRLPALGTVEPVLVWTVRKLYGDSDAQFAICGVAA
jgi:hypothetical protein